MSAPAKQHRPPLGLFPDQPTPRLYDRIIEVLRVHHYSRRTEEAYVHWIRRYIEFHNHQHPRQLAEDDLNRFLTHLAVKEHVAASTWLIATLLYGGALRLLEALRLRVKDLDFERGEITVREGKGDKDRVTMLPHVVSQPLQDHLQRILAIHQQDVADGYGRVELPHALARKYPNANREWRWQFVFPQEHRWRNSSPPTCWLQVTISARCRSCLATRTFARP